jgi:hypothetical protein
VLECLPRWLFDSQGRHPQGATWDGKGTSFALFSANMLATLLLSQGTPMMLAGDEFGRTQQGNNAYCQDSEISWLDWSIEGNFCPGPQPGRRG